MVAFCAIFATHLYLSGSEATALAADQTGTRLILPGGTPLAIRLKDKVSSETANVGDNFTFEAASDTVVDGWIAIPKSSTGQGTVMKVDRAGKHGHAGSLALQLDWVYAADGNRVKLTSQPSNAAGESKAGTSSTVTIISSLFLGIPGLFAHNFVKGKDVTLDGETPLRAYVDESVYVVASNRSTQGTGYAPSAVSSTAPGYSPPVSVPSPKASPEKSSPTAFQ
jgi:hypothetical protein